MVYHYIKKNKNKPTHCYLNCQETLIFCCLFYHSLEKYKFTSVHSHLLLLKERHFNSVKAEIGLGVLSAGSNSLSKKKIPSLYL